MKKTLEDYGIALKKRYDEVKNEDVSGLLLHPSPANLKTLCMVKAERTIGIDDQRSFELFFNLTAGETLKKINAFDIDKFRPIGNFLKGKTNATSKPILEMIAILIDYDLRPYGRFIKSEFDDSDQTNNFTNTLDVDKSKHPNQIKKPAVEILIDDDSKATETILFIENNNNIQSKKNRTFLYIGIAIVLFVCLGYVAKKEFFPTKDCLQWTTDRYEAVACKGVKIQSLYENRMVAWNADLLHFRKLSVTNQTKFFINGQPAVWYSKKNNEVEFFNAPGLHPISAESLKPVTKYIVEKYGLPR